MSLIFHWPSLIPKDERQLIFDLLQQCQRAEQSSGYLKPDTFYYRKDRTGHRYVMPTSLFDDNSNVSIVINNMIEKYFVDPASEIHKYIRFNTGKIPLPPASCYINLYRDGNDSTPNHKHDGTIQIVFSFGATRTLKLGSREYNLNDGDVIIFGSQIHGVPKQEQCTETRYSIAFFVELITV